MKMQKRSLMGLFVFAVVLATPFCILLIGNARDARITTARRLKTFAAQRAIFAKLEEYDKLHGHYPQSLDALSFTNSPEERELLQEVTKFEYRLDEKGFFDLGYHQDGLNMGPTFTKEAQPDAAPNRDPLRGSR